MTGRSRTAFFSPAAGLLLAGTVLLPASCLAGGLAEGGIALPSWAELARVLTLQDYNTRVVIIGATLLGLAAGLSGTFLLLRKRALLSDTLSHATLPGIALAFILMSITAGDGKHLLGLIAGAAVFSVLGTASVLLLQRYSRLKDDAALGIVLSVYFGAGIALMGVATRMESGSAAGLSSFIYGKTASMLFSDAVLIAATAFASALFCLFFFKEFSLVCFDADYASSQGWPVGFLDFFMMAIVVVVTVIGLQAVGLILVVALLIIPAAAARFWTYRLNRMLLLSGLFGAASGLLGAGVSALMANLPAGAVIVLSASAFFVFSLVFGSARGLLRIGIERVRLRRKIMAENVLRDLLERAGDAAAASEPTGPGASIDDLLRWRPWPPGALRRTVRRLRKTGRITAAPDGFFTLTEDGMRIAEDVLRRHRLWETYLITHADVAPGMVDLSADRIEHVLDAEMIEKLEALLPEVQNQAVPESPHPVKGAA